MKIPAEFDEIRPYEPEEVPQILHELIEDRQFSHVLQGFVPWMPKKNEKLALKVGLQRG